jgi:UDP-N-acetylenolpyruvoylglucosamine reductase
VAHAMNLESIQGTAGAMVTQRVGTDEVRFSDLATSLRHQITLAWRTANALRSSYASSAIALGRLVPRPVVPDAVSEPRYGP